MLGVTEDLATLAQQRLTGVGEANGAAVALQQGDPDVALEPAYLLGEGGLSDVQALGRAPEVKFFGDRNEVLDEPQIESLHSHSLLIGGSIGLGHATAVTANDHKPNPSLASRSQARDPCNCSSLERSGGSRECRRKTWDSRLARPSRRVQSRTIIDAAIAEAESMSVPVTAVVVDESGNMKAMTRMDGAPLVSVQTAINKAYAAAAIGMPPDDFYAAIESDSAAVTEFGSRPGLALIAGGLPLVADGKVAGALGVAGAMTGAEDRRIAEVAITASGSSRRLTRMSAITGVAADARTLAARSDALRAQCEALAASSADDGARATLARVAGRLASSVIAPLNAALDSAPEPVRVAAGRHPRRDRPRASPPG